MTAHRRFCQQLRLNHLARYPAYHCDLFSLAHAQEESAAAVTTSVFCTKWNSRQRNMSLSVPLSFCQEGLRLFKAGKPSLEKAVANHQLGIIYPRRL